MGVAMNSRRARMPVSNRDRIIKLHDSDREQIAERHPCQPDIQRPERNLRRPSLHASRPHQVAQAEQQQADREHPVNAHHRGVGVIGGKAGADLVVADHRQIDQEAENAGTEKIPEAGGDQKPHRPSMRMIFRQTAPSAIARSPERMNAHASRVSISSGITSIAEKAAPSAICAAGVPLK